MYINVFHDSMWVSSASSEIQVQPSHCLVENTRKPYELRDFTRDGRQPIRIRFT